VHFVIIILIYVQTTRIYIFGSNFDIMSDIKYTIETALSHQRAGRLKEAAGIYQKILEIDPKQSDAMHLLGMVFFF